MNDFDILIGLGAILALLLIVPLIAMVLHIVDWWRHRWQARVNARRRLYAKKRKSARS